VRRAPICAVLWIIAAAAPAYAAEEGGGLLYPAINFALLFVTLFVLLRKPIRAFFGDRRAAIRKDLEEAATLERRAREHYTQWQRRLVDLETELAEIRTSAQQRAEAERASLIADARAAAERIRSDAANAVEHQLRRARAGLREEASQLAIELASGILREKVTAQDRDRLIDEFIERVGRPSEAGFAQRAEGERRPEGEK
jgi:F-type H+-transporting ATPase subunit b